MRICNVYWCLNLGVRIQNWGEMYVAVETDPPLFLVLLIILVGHRPSRRRLPPYGGAYSRRHRGRCGS
jgi:hypothetical protein